MSTHLLDLSTPVTVIIHSLHFLKFLLEFLFPSQTIDILAFYRENWPQLAHLFTAVQVQNTEPVRGQV